MKNNLRILTSFLLLIFGGLSTLLTLSIIFDLFGIREIEGNYVLFIVYLNLLCGAIYLYAAYTNWKKETKTTAMLFRITLTALFIASSFYLNKNKSIK